MREKFNETDAIIKALYKNAGAPKDAVNQWFNQNQTEKYSVTHQLYRDVFNDAAFAWWELDPPPTTEQIGNFIRKLTKLTQLYSQLFEAYHSREAATC